MVEFRGQRRIHCDVGRVDAIRAGDGHPVGRIRTDARREIVRLHDQAPARVIRRPRQGQHVAGDAGGDVRRCSPLLFKCMYCFLTNGNLDRNQRREDKKGLQEG